MKRLIIFCILAIVCYACSKKADIDPLLQVKPTGLFTYDIIQEGDGLVSFIADSTQTIKEFIWDFGDGTIPTSLTTVKVSHPFTKNATFQIKLTAKNNAGQISETKAVNVNSRFARSIDDIPTNELTTLRVLHIICGSKANDVEHELKNDPFNYLNLAYQHFILNHPQLHKKEYEQLKFDNYFYYLNKADSSYIYSIRSSFTLDNYKNPILNGPQTNDTEKQIFKKLILQKQKYAASLVVFWMPFEIGGITGYASKSGYYAVMRNNDPQTYYSQLLNSDKPINDLKKKGVEYKPTKFWNMMPVLAHELGHNLGMDHDISNTDKQIMNGSGTTYIRSNDIVYTDLPLFQIQNFEAKNSVLEELDPIWVKQTMNINSYIKVIPDIFLDQTRKTYIIRNAVFHKGAETSGGTSFFPVLEDHLIEQFNIKLAPSKITNFQEKIPRNGRLSINNILSKSIE